MEDPKELETIIRSLLLSSTSVINAAKLQREFELNEERKFPFQKLGFSSFVDYLKSIPSVVKLVPPYSTNPDVYPFATEQSKHIDLLVSKQRSNSSKRGSSSRRGGYNGRPTREPFRPVKRQPASIQPPDAHPSLRSTSYTSNVVHVRDLEDRFKESYRKETAINHEVNSQYDYCKRNSATERFDSQIPQHLSAYPSENSAKNSDRLDVTWSTCTTSRKSKETHIYANNNFDDLQYKDNQFWDQISEEQLSNYTIDRYTQDQQIKDTSVEKKNYLEVKDEEQNSDGEFDYDERISPTMMKNFQKILEKHPNGFLACDLPKKYLEETGYSLDFHDLGFTSLMMMVSSLPNIFTFQKVNGNDYTLYDARKVEHDIFTEKSEYPGQKDYIPLAIIDKIKSLVDQNPGGLRSTNLINMYKEQYQKNLDLETLGFKKVEDFVELLSDEVTLIKVKDYFVLLPKHTNITRNSVKEAPSEQLMDFLKAEDVLIPDNVLKKNDSIPQEALPIIGNPPLIKGPPKLLLEMDIRVSEVISPGLFYVLLASKYHKLNEMMDNLDKFYKQEEDNYHIPLPYLSTNLYCACLFDSSWHRAKITGFRKDRLVDIEYIDFGTPAQIKSSELRFLHKDFSKLPTQAICAKLFGLKFPKGEKKWSDLSKRTFLKMVEDKKLVAHVYNIETKQIISKGTSIAQLEMILFDTTEKKEVVINEDLVTRKLASFINEREENTNENNNCPPATNGPRGQLLSLLTSHSSAESIQEVNFTKPSRPPPGFQPKGQDDISKNLINESTLWDTLSPNIPFQNSNSLVYPYTQASYGPNIASCYQPGVTDINYGFLSMSAPVMTRPYPFIPYIPLFIPSVSSSQVHINSFNVNNSSIPQGNSLSIQEIPSDRISDSFQNSYIQAPQLPVNIPGLVPTASPPHQISNAQSFSIRTDPKPYPQEHEISSSPASKPENSLITQLFGGGTKPNPSSNSGSLYGEELLNENKGPKQNIDITSDDKLEFQTGDDTQIQYLKSEDNISKELKSVLSADSVPCDRVHSIASIPDNWEEIEIDETPASSNDFTLDFKNALDLDLIQPTPAIQSYSLCEVDKTDVINWKDRFDPDINVVSKRIEKQTAEPRFQNIDMKKVLVHKLELGNKVFHLMCVNSKLAVLSYEFYPQLVTLHMTTLCSVVGMYFSVICRKDHPALFAKLDEITFHGGVDKRKVLQLGKASITYLADIPDVLKALHISDGDYKSVLNEIKNISQEFSVS